MRDEIKVRYTVDDDGLHMECECGWVHIFPLGEATVEEIIDIANDHRSGSRPYVRVERITIDEAKRRYPPLRTREDFR